MTEQTDQAELKWFWEQCGLEIVNHPTKHGEFWKYPSGVLRPSLPQPDDPLFICFLFKYAVPKVWELEYSIYMHIGKTLTTCLCEPYHYRTSKCKQAQNEDPTLALYQTITNVLKERDE